MKILISILFVVFAALAGFSKPQVVSKTSTKVDGIIVAERQLNNPETFQVNVYFDQDSNESNHISLFFIERMQLPKPACLDAKSVTLPHRSFYHISLNNLLIDLPPPANSKLV